MSTGFGSVPARRFRPLCNAPARPSHFDRSKRRPIAKRGVCLDRNEVLRSRGELTKPERREILANRAPDSGVSTIRNDAGEREIDADYVDASPSPE